MNKLRFGIVGTNFISDWVIAGGLQDSRFELSAVYSRTEKKANEFADKYNVPHRFTSIEKMAASPLIDAVYIASPNAFHARQSILFMEHGKHVLCEKAFASNAKQVNEMIAAACKNKTALMEAFKPTLTPNFAAVQEAISKIGCVRRYFSCYCQYSSRYDKFREGIVLNAFQPELSNGSLLDIGVYAIYPMVVLFGRPQEVKAVGFKLSSGVDGQGSVIFLYPTMDAVVIFSKISNSSLSTEIQGEDGNIELDRINIISNVNLQMRGKEKENISRHTEKNEYYYEIKEFIDIVQDGRQESYVNTWKNSLITMEIMDEIRRQLGVVYPADI